MPTSFFAQPPYDTPHELSNAKRRNNLGSPQKCVQEELFGCTEVCVYVCFGLFITFFEKKIKVIRRIVKSLWKDGKN